MNVEDISKIKLNPQQQDAVEQILTFSRDPMARLLRIDGPAGTGKSTVASFAARELYGEGVQIALAAPTNKASGNLDSMSERIAPGASIRIGTIYSLLGLRLGNSGEKRELINTEQHKLEGVKLVFVDEWSMIGQELLDYIRKFSQDTGIKFVFLGDPYQLPPVGSEESPVRTQVPQGALLTKVERHDNQILTLATHIRECIDAGIMPTFKSDRDADGGVALLRPADYRKQLRKAFSSDSYQEQPNEIRALAWRNAIVDSYNESIREEIYGSNAQPFEVGERVIVKAPVLDLPRWMGEKESWFLASVDEEANLTSVLVKPHPIYGEIECFALGFDTGRSSGITFVPTEAGGRRQRQMENDLAERARSREVSWAKFWDFKQMFGNLAPAHALTTHRSQGSTYRTVFVDLDDLFANKNQREAMRSAYTACTRPSRNLILKRG